MKVKLGEVRKAVKAVAPKAKVSGNYEEGVLIRVDSYSDIELAVDALKPLGLEPMRRRGRMNIEIEGTRWNPEWTFLAYPINF